MFFLIKVNILYPIWAIQDVLYLTLQSQQDLNNKVFIYLIYLYWFIDNKIPGPAAYDSYDYKDTGKYLLSIMKS